MIITKNALFDGFINLQNSKHTNKRFDVKITKENNYSRITTIKPKIKIGQGWEGFKKY